MKRNVNAPCPCRISDTNPSPKIYSACCGRFLQQAEQPDTAEELMRSRYTGFVLRNEAYLLESWHPETRPETIEFEDQIKWLGLKIREIKAGSINDTEGWVAFTARFKVGGKAERIEELSYFIKDAERWLYHSAAEHTVPADK